MDPKMQECIENCTACHNVCVETASHCLGVGGDHSSREHITILLDCAQTCAISADLMLRGSELHGRMCDVCAEACERCAQDCDRLADGDETMLRCAEICRRCAESCRQMATMAA